MTKPEMAVAIAIERRDVTTQKHRLGHVKPFRKHRTRAPRCDFWVKRSRDREKGMKFEKRIRSRLSESKAPTTTINHEEESAIKIELEWQH